MNDFLNDTEQALCDSLARWLSDHIDLSQHARIDTGAPALSRALWHQMLQDLELLMATQPEHEGGLGGGLRMHMRILWVLGGSLFAEPYLSSGLVAQTALGAADGPDGAHRRQAWLQGRQRLAWAHAEPGHRRHRQPVATTLRATPQGWVLQGRKARVVGADAADHFLLSAHGPETGPVWLWLDAQTPGIVRRDVTGLDGASLSELQFEDVQVPAQALLCQGAAATRLGEQLQAAATLGACAEAVGLLQRMMQDTLDHVRQRRQFGQPLAGFQVVQHRLADMHLALAQAEALTWAVSDALTANGMSDAARVLAVSSCKVAVDRALRAVGQGAVQLHGAMGVTEELFTARCFRRATQLTLMLGQRDQHLRRMDPLLFAS